MLAEQEFHERVTPSLRQNVEHITSWTDLPPFQQAADLEPKFTYDIIFMDELCNDILGEVNISESSPSSLHVVALSVQLGAMMSGKRNVEAILLHTPYQNIVFQ